MKTSAGVAASPLRRLQHWLLRNPGVSRLALIAVLLGGWEWAARTLVDSAFLSPPSIVVASLGTVLGTPGVPEALASTLLELAVAFVLSVLIGISLGLAIGLNRFTFKSFMPTVLLIYGLPQITVLPIVILIFGIGPPSKIAFGVTHGIFPIIIAVAAGVQNIKPVLLVSARSMGAGNWHIFRHVIFPHMVPSLFTGMRLGMTGVLLGVLLAELYVSTAGIGYFTNIFTQNFDSAKLLALVSILAAMAIVLNEFVRRLETHYSRWRS